MVLRTGVQLNVAAALFGVSPSTAGRVFITWLCLLWRVHFALVRLPTRAEVNDNCPESVREQGLERVAVILDATEFTAERFWESNAAYYFFSTYKHRPTVKYIVGVTTSGAICFVSDGYGGRMTDNAVVRKCGFLDLLRGMSYPFGYEVLADKGFDGLQIDLCRLGMLLVSPPTSRARQSEKQFTAADTVQTEATANVRIHVERAIGALKEWRYLVNPCVMERARCYRQGSAALCSSDKFVASSFLRQRSLKMVSLFLFHG